MTSAQLAPLKSPAAAPLILLLLFSGAKAAESPCCFQAKRSLSGPVKVLLIGNSLTYFNNLPAVLESLSQAQQHTISAHMIASPGNSLEDHWKEGAALSTIRNGSWDFVILQEQSSLGTTFLVDGIELAANPELFYRYAALFIREIKKAGAEPVLFLDWAKEGLDESEQARLNYFYAKVSSEQDVAIAPIGMVWQRLRRNYKDLDLFIEDGLHPTPMGSYVAALTLFTTLTGAGPIGLSATLRGAVIDQDSGVETGGDGVLVDLEPQVSRRLQEEVWANHRFLHSSRLEIRDPGKPETPAPPPGRIPSSDELAGRWQGEIKLYPRGVGWPGRIELEVERQGRGVSPKGDLVMRFSKGVLRHPIQEFEISKQGVRFLDPEGPDGGVVRYTLSFVDGALIGIGEFIVEGRPVYGVGSVRLTKQ